MSMTQKEAIALANQHVSEVYEHVPNGFGFKTYDPDRDAWWMPSQAKSWHQAQQARSNRVAQEAVSLYCEANEIAQEPTFPGGPCVADYEAECAYIESAASTPQRFRRILKRIRKNM